MRVNENRVHIAIVLVHDDVALISGLDAGFRGRDRRDLRKGQAVIKRFGYEQRDRPIEISAELLGGEIQFIIAVWSNPLAVNQRQVAGDGVRYPDCSSVEGRALRG